MDLPDCPPGAEGYEDSVTEIAKKPEAENSSTKAEQEFFEYINSLKVTVEDGETRSMVERRDRDSSGKWTYVCFICTAVCSGESIMQTHLLGKKHKNKSSTQTVWPKSTFDYTRFNQTKPAIVEKNPQKLADKSVQREFDEKFNKFLGLPCQIQEAMDVVKVPMLGVEYLVEFPAEQEHHKASYLCTLCNKQAHPRTIINHMICFRHRHNYLKRHFPKATLALSPFWARALYREGVGVIVNRLASRIEDSYGRMRPLLIDKDDFDKDRDSILQWIFQSPHYSENSGNTFEEVVDVDLIKTMQKIHGDKTLEGREKDPSPPVVAAPSKPLFNSFKRSANRQERRAGSVESLSDISDEVRDELPEPVKLDTHKKDKRESQAKLRYEPYPPRNRSVSPGRPRHARTATDFRQSPENASRFNKQKPSNYDYKVKLAQDQSANAEASAKKTFAYHEKNPEKHPLYPEEWKKFWNRRYKELQSEGKDASKYDFKPEWIQFWTERMKEIHEEELRISIVEIYRKLCVTPPDMSKKSVDDRVLRSKSRSPELKRRSPEPKWSVHVSKRRSPDVKRRPVESRRRSPERRRSVDRRRSPNYRRDYRRERKFSPRHHSPARRRSPPRVRRTRSRSPHVIRGPREERRGGSGARVSRSPGARRESPAARQRAAHPATHLAPSMQTVLISDDELKPDEDLSPWNSGEEMASPRSATRSRAGSVVSRASRAPSRAPPRHDAPHKHVDCSELGPAENVVATLRLLVALEDHLGSLGPKVVDLLAEALKMEKESANSSEELLVRESAVVLLETSKEKLKGAAQAGLVPPAAAAAVRAAVVRVAATLHEADLRKRTAQQDKDKKTGKVAVPVAGVGEVDRAQIAQQMAEALIAQGKTDVTSEELAQLVDAVIGMAEAKKREAGAGKQEAPKIHPDTIKYASKARSTVSALQMLQSAYDENEKRLGKEDGSDAMDGLSDSDLETLLKNFNELSAEEQHSLIAYLKKLEAKEPLRVERLRQYVNTAVTGAPKVEDDGHKSNTGKAVAIESDDDDYTVEEVFKSATQKVKENQIRQEMEIVKKSLEETKPVEVPNSSTIIDLTNSLSSASDILALVQASIQSSTTGVSLPTASTAEVVTSNTQPKSFGDPPEMQHNMPLQSNASQPQTHHIPYNPPPQTQHPNFNMNNNLPINQQQPYIRPPHNPMNYGGNRNSPNENFNQPRWNDRPMNNMQDQRGPQMLGQQNFDNYNQGDFNQGHSNPNYYKGRQDFPQRPNMNQQHYGNYNPQNNYRGRGQYGGQGRGRGRGGYY